MKNHDLILVSNRSGEILARSIGSLIGSKYRGSGSDSEVRYVETNYLDHPDGENEVQLRESIRGGDVFYICPFQPDPMTAFSEAGMMRDSIHHASAGRLTFVPTYIGFGRSDWKDKPRKSLGSREVAQMMEGSALHGLTTRVLTMDMHAEQTQAAFRIPIDHLEALPVCRKYAQSLGLYGDDLVVVSPDTGGAKRAERYARALHADLAVVHKKRRNDTDVRGLGLMGDVRGRRTLIVDDQYSTCGSVAMVVELLREAGVKDVYGFATHGVFARKDGDTPAEDKLRRLVEDGKAGGFWTTNSIPRGPEWVAANPHIKVLEINDLFAEAIDCIHTDKSISSMFRYD